MILYALILVIGLWAIVMGITQQIVGKNHPKIKYVLYIVITLIFIVYFTIQFAKHFKI